MDARRHEAVSGYGKGEAQAQAARDLQERRVEASAITDDQGRIVIFGGDLESKKPSIERFDPSTGEWEKFSAPERRLLLRGSSEGEGLFYRRRAGNHQLFRLRQEDRRV